MQGDMKMFCFCTFGWKRSKLETKNYEAKIVKQSALKVVRYERKQVETCSNKNSIKDSTTDKHSRSTRKCREESKKRRGERENTQIVSTKQAARIGKFHIYEKGFKIQ